MLGYIIGGFVAEKFGYTTAFVSCGAVYALSGIMVMFMVKEDFNRKVEAKKLAAVKKPFRQLLTPAVAGIMLMVALMGIARRIDEPFLTELVSDVMKGGTEVIDFFFFSIEGSSVFFTGIVSAAAALGGIFSGVAVGWLCDRMLPRKLLIPVLICSALGVVAQLFAPGVISLTVARFFASFAAGGILPILQLMLTQS